ncbi:MULTISPECIES: NAD(P)/FAD-dependent oxidoreductase [Acetobacter]|uniref:Ferredoxin--NADP reductase n=3 Tax=Acetobacter TaxID=434 RepID=F1YVU4_9PROT|nr:MULTISPECIES: NAD(P)/FAD-dependent oxidoreductase [Acetobacter]ASL39604.1 NAD(P)/FAD-dependent oxidoreductase [Acetobacter oryzifermentans]ATI11759.1 NAD(P)/FAD-dependent oxidoreductase [Acetobacter pomorum]AXC25868.1 NAD(P)/FAD-dependent oxidoreductase [Acetobacter sp. JWB]AXN00968.1 NAD(P)/FAD-dependent oxidoreductase [Acetobacter pomorum]EGE47399.1 Ferredoxin--NADP reductase [Acetobacter pomorum DM001]
MTDTPAETDVAIIGAGPAGLFAAFQCAMLRLNCVLIDVLPEVGGQCAALYPEKPIYDIPACPAVEGAQLIARLEEQIAPFNIPRLLKHRVESLTGNRGNFTLGTNQGTTLKAKAIIIAAGAGAFGPNRPPLDGLEAFEDTGAVQYYVRRKADFAGRRIVIAGGGDSALDWALSLKDNAEKLYLVHRRDRFRGAPESLRQLEEAVAAGQIEKVVPYQLHALHGQNGALKGVEVADLDGATRMLEADVLLPFFGLATDLGPVARWGMDTMRSTIPVTPSSCETSLPGVFAVGDVATYPGKLKLILQGFSEAAMAAHAIYPIVNPDQALHFEYSTSKGVPA